jgi:hypothetical protein
MICLLAAMPSLAFGAGSAEETREVEELKEQLRQANQAFEQAVQQHQAAVEAISRRIESLETGADGTPPPTSVATVEPVAQPAEASAMEPKGWSPADPIRVGNSKAWMEVGVVGTFAVGGSTSDDIQGGTELGGHDPNQNGFTIQGIETTFSGAVDPYFRALVALNFSIDAEGESFFEMEEGWMETVSLPASLQFRIGQMYSQFGRQNPTHLHTWDFVDVQLINGRFMGPDGLRNPGAYLSWLAPTPFYLELLFGVQDSQGETAASFRSGEGHQGLSTVDTPFSYRNFDNDRGVESFADMLITPRVATSFDLSDEITLLLGASAALGPNDIGAEDSGDTRTEIYGADLTVKWKSSRHHGGFPFVAWQTEGMWRNTGVGAFDWAGQPDPIYDLDTGDPAVLASETLSDYGFYTQLVYGFRKGWTVGLRFDWVQEREADYEQRNLSLEPDGSPLGSDPLRNDRWRLSPNLTWYPSEYSKIRLQYNYDDQSIYGTANSVWLQFEFLLGSHAAHRF